MDRAMTQLSSPEAESASGIVCPKICSDFSTCQLSYRAREIFSKFLCSKATTPVNIDSQAQLADDILNAPHPDMFKEQQLQVTLQTVFLPWDFQPGLGVQTHSGHHTFSWEGGCW